jgi:hypothetical protein
MTHVWTIVRSHTAVIASGRPFSPSHTTMHTSATPRCLSSVRTASQNFAKAHMFARTCARWRLNCHGFGRRAVSTWSKR